jgi:hypothetical protein
VDSSFPDPPPITEDDIQTGMMNLVNRGVIPKDVDLTPAFERGAAPFGCRPARIYDKIDISMKNEVQIGGSMTHNIKYDLQPHPIVRPIYNVLVNSKNVK